MEFPTYIADLFDANLITVFIDEVEIGQIRKETLAPFTPTLEHFRARPDNNYLSKNLKKYANQYGGICFDSFESASKYLVNNFLKPHNSSNKQNAKQLTLF